MDTQLKRTLEDWLKARYSAELEAANLAWQHQRVVITCGPHYGKEGRVVEAVCLVEHRELVLLRVHLDGQDFFFKPTELRAASAPAPSLPHVEGGIDFRIDKGRGVDEPYQGLAGKRVRIMDGRRNGRFIELCRVIVRHNENQ